MKLVNFLFLIAVLCFTANTQAAFTEDFDTFADGTLVAQESWEENSGFDVVAAGAGKALKSNTYTDKITRHDATGVDFGLAMDQDGIEYGFDFMEEVSNVANMRLFLRKGLDSVYSPSFGLNGGVMCIRPAGESGTTIYGNDFAGGGFYGTEGEGGYWVKGEWLQFKIILTGEGFDTATVKAYNLSRGGLEIPTGLTDVSLGVNPKYHPGWTRFNLRGGTTGTNIDNVYVTDYTAPAPGLYIDDFETLTLGSINQTGWRDNALDVTVVSTTSSGEYTGGQGLKAGSSSDEWPQYAVDRNESFGLQVDIFDGIEMGFDFMDSVTNIPSCRMHFRAGMTANYSPAFGLNGGAFSIRSLGEGGDTYTGDSLGALGAGLYEKGDWITIRLVLRGTSFNTATLFAYNMTKSVEIPTGLVNVSLGTNPQDNASGWSRLVFRMASSADTYVDNAYISDYVHSGVTADVLSPTNGQYPVAIEGITLSWLSGAGATSHKVYFGTDAGALNFEIETTDTSYLLPYTLENGIAYYWRIDEVVDGVDNTGDVWSFTTELGDLNLPRRMAYEGFDYAPYVALKSSGNGYGGFGWATGWERAWGEYCYVTVGSGSLDPAMDYLLGTNGNKIQFVNSATAGNNDAMRKLEYPIDLRADQDYYISYLAMGDADTYNSVRFRLLEDKSSSGFGVDMFYQGYPNVTTPTAYVRDFSGGWVSNPIAGWASDVVSLVIIKIEANAVGDDIVSVCLFDSSNPLPMEEPAVWQQSISAEKNTVYGWLQFFGRGDAYDQWHVDEIHVGTGWGAVTGWATACGDLGTIMDWDLNEDCQVNLGDMAILAGDWLRCTDPAGVNCEWVIDPEESVFSNLAASALGVYEAVAPVTIDGDLSEWAGSRWYNARFTSGYNVANAADITDIKMALQWDQTTPEVVYMAVKVTDTDQNLTDAPTAWNSGDNLELRFSVNDTSTDTQWIDNYTYDIAQYYHVFPKDSGGTWCTLGSVHDPNASDPASDDIDVVYATSLDGDDIIYEMALPTYSDYTSDPNNTGDLGTKLTLADGEVIAVNLQFNSVSAAGVGALFEDQDREPNNWFKFVVTANSSLLLGDMGFIDTDLDLNGEVGLSDLDAIAQKWLSCTDPEISGCDQPWAP